MPARIALRIASAALTLIGVATLVFALLHLVPGDPIDVMLGESAAAADREALRRDLGLDRPVVEQWLAYLGELARGRLGTSLYSGETVRGILAARLPHTLLLAVAALGVSLLVSVPLGLAAAERPGGAVDAACTGLAVTGLAVPNFCLGPLLILVFALGLGWLPVSGSGSAAHLVLPALTLGTGLAAMQMRMIRASALGVLGEDFVRTARAKGLAPARVRGMHVLRPAAGPLLTILGLQIGALLGGTVITETVFDWPGVGRTMVEAIQRRDYPLVQGLVLFTSAVYVAVNALTDSLCLWLDPRVGQARP